MQTNYKIETIAGRGLTAFGAVAALLLAAPLSGQNLRTWVSTHGSDQNNCTIAAPCRTFQHAHDATALFGEIDVLDPGEYGPVVISKSLTIDAANMGYIESPTPSSPPQSLVAVSGAPSSVTLRNLSIRGPANAAILWTSGGYLSIEGVSIDGLGNGSQSGDLGIFGLGNGIAAYNLPAITVRPVNGQPTVNPVLVVKDVVLRNVSYGMQLSGHIVAANPVQWLPTGLSAVVDHATIENTEIGIYLGSGNLHVTHSVIAHGIVTGINCDSNPGGEVNLEDSSIVYANTAMQSNGSSCLMRIAGNNIHDNETGLLATGGQIVSFGNNRIQGNGTDGTPTSTAGLK